MWEQTQCSAFDDEEYVATYKGGPLKGMRKAQAMTTELDKIACSVTERHRKNALATIKGVHF